MSRYRRKRAPAASVSRAFHEKFAHEQVDCLLVMDRFLVSQGLFDRLQREAQITDAGEAHIGFRLHKIAVSPMLPFSRRRPTRRDRRRAKWLKLQGKRERGPLAIASLDAAEDRHWAPLVKNYG